jgi:hypothetical protein
MIRVDISNIFPIAATVSDTNGNIISGEDVYFDIRYTDDTPLIPANIGIMHESTVASGIYKQDISIDIAGSFICYITCAGYPTTTKDIVVNQETVAEEVWSDTLATALLTDVEFIKDVEGGRWKILNKQLIFYKEDNITEIASFDLFNKLDEPTDVDVYERVRL